MITLESILEKATELTMTHGPKLLLAIVTLIVGLWIIKWIMKAVHRSFQKTEFDEILEEFLENIISIILKVMLFIAVIGMVGIETTSFVAVLAAMGFAVGLALQGSLSNFAGGVLIIIFKPFSKGEYIEAQGQAGTVETIEIFTTTLKTPDNKTVIIPNGALANGNIINYSREKTRRVDLVFGIGYDDDIKKAQKILLDIATKHKKVIKTPKPLVRVAELADSSVNFNFRVWVKTEDYWDVYFDMTETVKTEFDKNKISIPYPQTDVHVHKV